MESIKTKFILAIKDSSSLVRIFAFLYSIINNWYRPSFIFTYLRCLGVKGAFFKKSKICQGLEIGSRSRITNCSFSISGSNSRIIIKGKSTIMNNVRVNILGDNCTLYIDEGFTMEGGSINLINGKDIHIGKDCMFSESIFITNGDFHTIIDLKSNERINEGKPISIGNHVWLGADVKVLKGSVIPDGCVLGTGSIVSGLLQVENAIYAGAPAKCIKRDIRWSRER